MGSGDGFEVTVGLDFRTLTELIFRQHIEWSARGRDLPALGFIWELMRVVERRDWV